MGNNGFITLHRKILEWEWYKDGNTRSVFLHLLLKANWEDGTWKGIDVKRGQVVTSISHLSDELNVTQRAIRTSLERLAKSREIDRQTTNKYSVITILNYDKYQLSDRQSDEQNDRQSDRQSDEQVTGKMTTNEEYNNKINKKDNNNTPLISPHGEKQSRKKKEFIPPTLEEVKEYAESRGNIVDAKEFYDYFDVGNWIDSKGEPVLNWKQKYITGESKRKEKNNSEGLRAKFAKEMENW